MTRHIIKVAERALAGVMWRFRH